MSPTTELSAPDLRAAAARGNCTLYKVAAITGINPSKLSRVLHERDTLTQPLAERIFQAIKATSTE